MHSLAGQMDDVVFVKVDVDANAVCLDGIGTPPKIPRALHAPKPNRKAGQL